MPYLFWEDRLNLINWNVIHSHWYSPLLHFWQHPTINPCHIYLNILIYSLLRWSYWHSFPDHLLAGLIITSRPVGTWILTFNQPEKTPPFLRLADSHHMVIILFHYVSSTQYLQISPWDISSKLNVKGIICEECEGYYKSGNAQKVMVLDFYNTKACPSAQHPCRPEYPIL